MCGRFTLTSSPSEISEHFGLSTMPAEILPGYNISPIQEVPVVRNYKGIGYHLDHLLWGLIPTWSKDRRIANKLINARAETIAEKPAFRSAYRKRRCLIPSNGFYEWKKTHTGKQPYWIGFQDRKLFSFAGIWEHWTDQDTGTVLESFCIITTSANKQVDEVHKRMPVIVPENKYTPWLDLGSKDEELKEIMVPYKSEDMIIYPVSRNVNNPTNNYEDLLMPANLGYSPPPQND